MGPEIKPILNGSKYHKTAADIYLTEFGLYECLFTSNKPFAFEFRLQIMKLLKDIRIGNLKLIAERECKSTQILKEKSDSLMSFITENSNLKEQIKYLETRFKNA